MHLRTTTWIAALLTVLAAAPVAADQSHETRIARIEAPRDPEAEGPASMSLAQIMADSHVPGLSVAVIEDFEIVWLRCYGVADVATGRKVEPTTLFQAASISKPVAAMAAMRAVQEGRLRLDDPINSVLKSWQLPANDLTHERPVTARMLLSHTAGTTVPGFPGYEPGEAIPTVIDILDGKPPANTAAVIVNLAPWTKFRYSGGGTTIMQLALCDIYKKPFGELLDEKVLRPLEMNESRFDQPPKGERANRAARAHNDRGEAEPAKWHVYPELEAAGLWTTPSDLAKFAIEVQLSLSGRSNRVLNEPMARTMVTPVEVGHYGVGFETQQRGDNWYFGHSGGNWGFRCNLLAHCDGGYGAAIMTNGAGGNTVVYELRRRIAKEYDWGGDFDRMPDNWPEDE